MNAQTPFTAALAAGAVTLSAHREPRTNALEAFGYETGFMGKNKPRAACYWSVWKIEDGIAHVECTNAWGAIIAETRPVHHLAAYIKGGA